MQLPHTGMGVESLETSPGALWVVEEGSGCTVGGQDTPEG